MADTKNNQQNGAEKLDLAIEAAKNAGFDLGAKAAAFHIADTYTSLKSVFESVPYKTETSFKDALDKNLDEIKLKAATKLTEATGSHNAAVDKLGLETVQSLQERIATLCIEKNVLSYAPLQILNDANQHMTDINIVYGKPSVAENGDVILMQNNGVDFNATQDCSPSP